MRVKIFTVHHFLPQRWVANDLLAPFVTGQAVGSHPVLLSDESGGETIAHESSYNEMRAQYYVWKNLLADYDYVGFQHYRRYFFFDGIEAFARNPLGTALREFFLKDPRQAIVDLSPDHFLAYLGFLQQCGSAEIEAVQEFIGRYDILCTKPLHFSIGEQYCSCCNPADWETLKRLLPQHSYFLRKPRHLSFDLQMLHACNMYIMRASEFDEYMTFWREALLEFAKEVKPNDDPYQSRVYGFISERLFTLYLYQRRMEKPNLRVAEMPVVMCSALQGAI